MHTPSATRPLRPLRWSALDCLLDCLSHATHDDDVLTALRAWANETGNRFAPLSAARRQSLLARIDAMTPQCMHIAWLPIRRVVETGVNNASARQHRA